MRRGRRLDGVTLIEVVVVLAILGVAAAVSLPAWREAARPDALRDGTGVVTRLLARARTTARTAGHRVTVTIDPVAARYWIDAPALAGTFDLPSDVSLWSDRPRARIVFEPAGSASADSLAVHARGRSVPIQVDALTGEVTAGAR